MYKKLGVIQVLFLLVKLLKIDIIDIELKYDKGVFMKKVIFGVVGIISMIYLTGCEDSYEKNIYHSEWKSSDGYRILIADPEENSNISTESCAVYMGDDKLGICMVEFNKSSETARIVWSYYSCKNSLSCLKTESVTISKDTNSFYNYQKK